MLKLEIRTTNAAFEYMESEVAHLLRETADKIEIGATHGKIRDSNGNYVGHFNLSSAS